MWKPDCGAYRSRLVLCGDFNAPRGGEIFTRLATQSRDNVPSHYVTSIDPKLHRAGPLQLMVDGLFSTDGYRLSEVVLHNGVSDHCTITAVVHAHNRNLAGGRPRVRSGKRGAAFPFVVRRLNSRKPKIHELPELARRRYRLWSSIPSRVRKGLTSWRPGCGAWVPDGVPRGVLELATPPPNSLIILRVSRKI